MVTLYLIRGVSGAGKSTLADELDAFGVVSKVIEADHYMYDAEGNYIFSGSKLGYAHKQCQTLARVLLLQGHCIAVSNTSTTEQEVEVYRKIAEECRAQFVSIIVENRSSTKSVHNVPEETLEKQRKRFSVKL